MYLWNAELSLISEYLRWKNYEHPCKTMIFPFGKGLGKLVCSCQERLPCESNIPSKTHFPYSKMIILSIISKKPVWWVAMILVVAGLRMPMWSRTWSPWRGAHLARSGGGRGGWPPTLTIPSLSRSQFRTIVLRPERQQHSADNQAEQAEEGQNCKGRIFYCGQNQPLVLRKQLGQVPLAVFDLQKGSP